MSNNRYITSNQRNKTFLHILLRAIRCVLFSLLMETGQTYRAATHSLIGWHGTPIQRQCILVTAVTAAGLDLFNIYMSDIVLNILLTLPSLILTVGTMRYLLCPHSKDEETKV